MAGYVRADTTNQIATGNVVDATTLDLEYDAIQAAFSASTGHVHDGTVGNGAPITNLGPLQDVTISGTQVLPRVDNTVDLGSTTLEWKDLWVDGTANIDSLVADTADINGGTIDGAVIGGTTPAAATVTALTATTGTVGGVDIVTTTATQALTNKTVDLTNNTLVATSAQLRAAVTDETGSGGALVFAADPALTGVPTAPTAAAATNTTQIATTAHVFAERTNSATLTNKTLTSPTINTPTINTPTISGGTITGITDLAIADGGTGASTAPDALINFGLTATAAEINTLDGITATTAELNILDGVTATTAELNKLAGTPAGLTATEIGYLDGVTSAIQTQLNAKQASDAALTSLAGLSLVSGDLLRATGPDALTRLAIGTNGHLLQVAAGIPAWASLYGASSLTFPNGFIRLPNNLHIMWGSFAAAGGSTTFNYTTISPSISLSVGSIAVVSSTIDGASTAQENTAGVVQCTTTGFRVYQANNASITTFFIAIGA